jgi:Na+/H+ antiporter NhaD/arsenite permease-like protein
MEKSTKKQLSLICFVTGFALLLIQDLTRIQTIIETLNLEPWFFPVIFYIGLFLVLVGYYLRG